ncbi:hypothetical protein F4679DRAFT_405387 [Xylaria curta]|nr:hypothetical protein F4679DRAFT_405387 [Xylaria curta]
MLITIKPATSTEIFRCKLQLLFIHCLAAFVCLPFKNRLTTPSWYEIAFWGFVLAFLARYNFYYAVASLSFFVTRLFWVWWPLEWIPLIPRSLFLCLLVWCYFLTPAHVLFTPMDLWATYLEHPSLNHVDILTWTYRDNSTETRWLKDLLPKEQGLANIRVVMVNHQTRWDANTADASFDDHAEMILKDIESVYEVRTCYLSNL